MDTLFKIELIVDETEQEESFPMQEQVLGPERCVSEIPASAIFAERILVTGTGIAAPVFVP